MTFKKAKQLKKGNEVIDRTTGKIIKVLCIKEFVDDYDDPIVIVKGICDNQGNGQWTNIMLK